MKLYTRKNAQTAVSKDFYKYLNFLHFLCPRKCLKYDLACFEILFRGEMLLC